MSNNGSSGCGEGWGVRWGGRVQEFGVGGVTRVHNEGLMFSFWFLMVQDGGIVLLRLST